MESGFQAPVLQADILVLEYTVFQKIMSGAKVKDLSEETKALFTAVREAKESQVRQSLKAGADVNGFKCGATFTNKFEKRLIYFSEHTNLGTYKNSPLMLAVYKGNIHIVKILLDSGANVNASNGWGITPLMKAAANPKCSVQLTKLLIKEGADATITNRLGQSALHFAVSSDSEECVKVLVAAGADVNKGDSNNKTPLMEACAIDSKKCASVLIQEAADVNQGDSNNKTPLMEACAIDSKKCVSVLIQEGADVNRVDNNHMTALLYSATKQTNWYYANNNGYNCMSLLLKSGAHLKLDNKGRNISERHILTQRRLPRLAPSLSNYQSNWNRRVLELLFAAGDKTDGTSIDATPNYPFSFFRDIPIPVPEFLQKLNTPKFYLMDMCRIAIRKQLIRLSQVNLYFKIPRLGLPPLLERYLLYGIDLDKDDDEDNDADNNYNVVPHITRSGRTSRRPDWYKGER